MTLNTVNFNRKTTDIWNMCGEPMSDREIADKILKSMEELYGFVPLVCEVMSERPDLFIPSSNLSRALFEGEGRKMDRKTAYLCAVAAASAVGGEHCIKVQGEHAKDAGATKEEMLEAMTIGALMAMTRSESIAFRKYKELFEDE